MIRICTASILVLVAASNVLAQRNLIDVPSSEIVEKTNYFAQQQLTYTHDQLQSSTIFTYGILKDFEVGLLVSHVVFTDFLKIKREIGEPEEYPEILVNLQKGVELKSWLSVGIGTRTGMNATTHPEKIRLANFNYLNSRFTMGKSEHHINAGVWTANKMYAGDGSRYGVMGGVDLAVLKDKLNLMGDFYSGTNALSLINAAVELSLPHHWKITVGEQFPFPGSDNNRGTLIQITKERF